jgi:putative phosphoribosyl transferase
MQPKFHDRRHAGRILAAHLETYGGRRDVLVLALPRGGVPVGFEVAHALRVPFDVFLVRKLGVPSNPELAMGAIAAGGIRVVDYDLIESLGIIDEQLDAVLRREEQELARRQRLYRHGGPHPGIAGRVVVLVDDGLATGATMKAAVIAIRAQWPARLVVAVPISTPSTYDELEQMADQAVCAMTPEPLHSVGTWYDDFTQTTDEEVLELLGIAAREQQERDRTAAVAGV